MADPAAVVLNQLDFAVLGRLLIQLEFVLNIAVPVPVIFVETAAFNQLILDPGYTCSIFNKNWRSPCRKIRSSI